MVCYCQGRPSGGGEDNKNEFLYLREILPSLLIILFLLLIFIDKFKK